MRPLVVIACEQALLYSLLDKGALPYHYHHWCSLRWRFMNLEDPVTPEKLAAHVLHEAVTLAPTSQTPIEMIDLLDSGIKAMPSALPKVPGYLLESELGRGGMGVVFLARQVRLNRLVALKMILSGNLACEKTRFRFLAEAEAIARVQHPGIVQVYEFGTYDNNPYFAMEYVKGGSLEKKLAGTPLHPLEAADLVQKLARAVQAAHDQGIIHRDIKPANVLLADENTGSSTSHPKLCEENPQLRKWLPKLTDFGLVKQVGQDMTVTGHIMGTPSYMAPEQTDSDKAVGPGVDIYALGAILYECLTGRPPFKAATPLDTILQLVNEEPVRVRQLQPRTPKGLELICMKCLQKQPGKRYASAQLLAEDLGRFLAGEPVHAQPPHLLPRASEWFRRHPWALINLFIILCGFLIGVTYGFWTRAAEAHWHRLIAEAKVDRLEERHENAMSKLIEASRLYQEPRLYDEAVETLKPKFAVTLSGEDYRKKLTATSKPAEDQPQAEDQRWARLLDKPLYAIFSQDRKQIALSGEKESSIVILDAERGVLERRLTPVPGRPKRWFEQAHHDETMSVGGKTVFSPDGQFVASHLVVESAGTSRRYIVMWGVNSGQEYLRVPDQEGSTLGFTSEGLVISDNTENKVTVWQPVALHDALSSRNALEWMHAMTENPSASHSMIFLDDAARWVEEKSMIPAFLVRLGIIFLPWIAVLVLRRQLAQCRKLGKLPTSTHLIIGFVIGVVAVLMGFLYLFTYFNTLGWTWEGLIAAGSIYIWFFGCIMAGTQLLVQTTNAYRVAEFGDDWKESTLLGSKGKKKA
ncbi:MAG TPA: serine/threonine-protein kinase [Gemmatales bacterium]|nr:serine/threonine-protein kinase [Gemmatales bacterium]